MADRLAMLPVALLLSAATVSAGVPPVGESFFRFAQTPHQIRDAVFSPAGDSLYLVDSDAQDGAIHVCDLQGRCARTVKHLGMGELDFTQPGDLVPWKGGFVLDSASLHLLWLDAELRPTKGWLLPRRINHPDAKAVVGDRGPLQEVTVWQVAPLSDQAVVVTGDYLDAKGWRHGVARLEGKDPLRLTVLSERRVDDPHYLYELHQRPSLVNAGDAVYELRFGDAPSLERVLPTPEHVALPKPFGARLPPLTGMGGRDGYLRLFGKLRTLPLPAAIRGWQNGLYLLTWTPRGGELDWDLWRWGAPGWRGPLRIPAPAQARDVLMAPGPNHWAFIFKPAPTTPEAQGVLGFRLMDSAEIERRLR
jgi:hypothetical protein